MSQGNADQDQAFVEEPLKVSNGAPLDAEYATPDDLFSTVAPKVEEIWVPELGKKVRIRAITGKERDAYEQSMTVGRGANQSVNMRNARAKLAALAIANPDGTRMFKDVDAGRLGDLPALALERIFDRARKMGGLTNEDMDELTGN